jgi:hypothetical protein
MTGINQGRPEMAIGEPIRLGSNNEFEIEQHPVSDRLIIRDTVNGKVAYVRKERGGQIGGDGVLVKALKEGKPVADDGRTHDTIQQAERAASGWVFVPPGTFNETVEINTEGLTLRGSGYNTHIDGGTTGTAITINAANVSVESLSVETTSGAGSTYRAISTGTNANNLRINGVVVRDSDDIGINLVNGSGHTVTDCTVESAEFRGIFIDAVRTTVANCLLLGGLSDDGIRTGADDVVIANNIVDGAGNRGIVVVGNDCIAIGNRVTEQAGDAALYIAAFNNCIVANNRVNNLEKNGTNTVLDGNLTGASN